MFEVYTADRSTRTGYVANTRAPGVAPVSAHDARLKTRNEEFVCANPQCTSQLVFVGPSADKRAHWRHASTDTAECSIDDGREAEGAWHLRVKNEFFGPKAVFEKTITTYRGDARLDVYVQNDGKRYAVEVQHSNISYDDAQERMQRHWASGLDGTVWLLDAATSGIHRDDVAWLASSKKQYPGRRGNLRSQSGLTESPPSQPHQSGVLVGAGSASSLIKLCTEMTASGYTAAVLIVAEAPGGELIARRVLEGYLVSATYSSGFVVRGFSRNLPASAQFRRWATGKKPGRGPAIGVKLSRTAKNKEVYFFGPDKISIFGLSDPSEARSRGGFVSAPKGFACPCPECQSRIADGLMHLHVAGVVSEPGEQAMDYIDRLFADPFSRRRINLQGPHQGVRMPDPDLWDHSAVYFRYGYWLEDLDFRLRGLGWFGHYDSYPEFVRDFEDQESFELAVAKD